MTTHPPGPPWLIAMWGAGCSYCRRGLEGLAPIARSLGLPLVALHVPELPGDEDPGAPEATLDDLGIPVGTEGIFHHRDARGWAELVQMRSWPTFLVVDADRRAIHVMIGWTGEDEALRQTKEAMRRVSQPP